VSEIGPGMKLRRFQMHSAAGVNTPEEDLGESFWFWCSGCDTNHRFVTKNPKGVSGPTWSFNGNLERPTFTPSLLYPSLKCHLYVTDGTIRYLDDCAHALRGKTVPLEGS
jgi:hypothetical protein